MKSKNIVEIRKKEIKDIQKLIVEKRKEAIEKNMEIKMGKEKNTGLGRNLRREVAALITIIKEKEALNG